MTDHGSIRVLLDTPTDGPANMARDEALLTCVGRGESPPTLRLYEWTPPTISLGYFQRYAEYESLPPPAGELPAVRRLTGGGAILHDQELTYSLALPLDHRLLGEGPNHLYELFHEAVTACLAAIGAAVAACGVTDDSGPTRGPFFCFARRHCYDLLLLDRKIAGSAQRRTRDAVLQHGSVILSNRFPQQPTAQICKPYASTIERVRSTLPAQLAERTGEHIRRGQWTDTELDLASDLLAKYAGDAWTRRM